MKVSDHSHGAVLRTQPGGGGVRRLSSGFTRKRSWSSGLKNKPHRMSRRGQISGRPPWPQHGFEESHKLKRTSLFSILAVVAAALLPLAATSQVAPERSRVERAEPSYKWEVFAGFGYTSLNQVNQSRYGLEGVNVSLTRDWGRYFGVTADGAFYLRSVATGNPGNPKVDAVLAGPVLHAPLYGHINGFVRVLLGGEHTGGESATPNISFAGGVGGGLEYSFSRHLALRVSGDDIAASFVQESQSPGIFHARALELARHDRRGVQVLKRITGYRDTGNAERRMPDIRLFRFCGGKASLRARRSQPTER